MIFRYKRKTLNCAFSFPRNSKFLTFYLRVDCAYAEAVFRRKKTESFCESLVRKKCLKRSTVLPFQKILLGFSKFCIFKSFRRCLLGRCWVLLLLVASVSNKGTFFQRWLTIRRIFTCFSCPHSKHAESTQKSIKLTLSHHKNLFPLKDSVNIEIETILEYTESTEKY
jgi:hypothetical protein